MTAGYSGTPLPKKLGITGESVYVLRHAPAGFGHTLGDVGEAVEQRNLMPPIDVIVTFHTERAKLVAEWDALTAAAEPDGTVWVAWPKRASGVPTDITEDTLRADLLPTGWVDNKVCAIDDTWSGLRFVQRKALRRPRDRNRR
jgi:hypothetical protein